jgi:hypothetical protein
VYAERNELAIESAVYWWSEERRKFH